MNERNNKNISDLRNWMLGTLGLAHFDDNQERLWRELNGNLRTIDILITSLDRGEGHVTIGG